MMARSFIPSRVLYMSTLEMGRSQARSGAKWAGLKGAVGASVADALSGGAASVVTQSVSVPVDVVAQRQMISNGESAGSVVRKVLRSDGLRGLYRGYGISLVTVVPSSALWWTCYGSYQSLWWRLLPQPARDEIRDWDATSRRGSAPSSLMALQALSGTPLEWFWLAFVNEEVRNALRSRALCWVHERCLDNATGLCESSAANR